MPTGDPPYNFAANFGYLAGNIVKAAESDFKRISVQVADPVTDDLTPYGVMIYNAKGQVIESLDFDRSPERLAHKLYHPDNMDYLRALAEELAKLPDFKFQIKPAGTALERDVSYYTATLEISDNELIYLPTTFENFLTEAVKYEILNQMMLNQNEPEDEKSVLATRISKEA